MKDLDAIIERSFTSFVFLILGEKFLTKQQKVEVESLGLIVGDRPLIELLYLLVKGRNSPLYRQDATLNRLLSQLAASGVLPEGKSRNAFTLEKAQEAVLMSLESAKQTYKERVKARVLEINDEYKNDITLTPVTVSERAELKEKKSRKLLKLVGAAAIGAAVYSAFRMGFTSAMTDLINETEVDDLVTMASEQKINAAKIKVFKQVVLDDRLSPECRKFHLNDDGTPKVYTLEELIRNGTNVGKPKSSWKPVIGKNHPSCRCRLLPASMIKDKKNHSR